MMLYIIFIVVIIIAIIMIMGSFKFQKEVRQAKPEFIIQLIEENKEDDRVAVSIIRNDEKQIAINEEVVLPLASTVQIIIAISFAIQSAEGKIDPNKKVPIEELERFNVSKTDGNAFREWLTALDNSQTKTEVTLMEIAQGMIHQSVNANTDYLIHVLSLDHINQIPKDLALKNHEFIFPIVSSLSIPLTLKNKNKLTDHQVAFAIRDLEKEKYYKLAIETHEKWMETPPTRLEKRRISRSLSTPIQRAWADRLPQGTTEDYVHIMTQLNSKEFFSPEVHEYLDPLLEKPMKQVKNQQFFKHYGEKSGGTPASLAVTLYATTLKGEEISLAFFAKDLNALDHVKASRVLRPFLHKFLKNEEYQAEIMEKLTEVAQEKEEEPLEKLEGEEE